MELAILSPDNFPLLDKMRKELIGMGYKPYENIMPGDTITLGIFSKGRLSYRNHNCNGIEQVTLTASNYNEILTRCKEAINTTK